MAQRADGARLPFVAGSFSAAASLTMFHRIPSAQQPDTALAEIARVPRPGGVLAGSDGLDTPQWRRVPQGDVFVPVDPGALAQRLRIAAFTDSRVEVAGDRFRCAATARTLTGGNWAHPPMPLTTHSRVSWKQGWGRLMPAHGITAPYTLP